MPDQAFDKELRELGKWIKSGLKAIPGAIKVIGLEFIHDNFAKQGFEKSPGGVIPWPKRKQPLTGSKAAQKKRRQGRSILVDKGFLRRSWAGDSKSAAEAVYFTSHLPYADVHNEGGKAGRGTGFTMPERKMIGDSTALQQRIYKEANRIIEEKLNFK